MTQDCLTEIVARYVLGPLLEKARGIKRTVDPKTGAVTIEQVERQKLTEEEVEEKEQLLAEGFGDWKRRDLLVCTSVRPWPSASRLAHTVRWSQPRHRLNMICTAVCCCFCRTSWQDAQSMAGVISRRSRQTLKASLWQRYGDIRLLSGTTQCTPSPWCIPFLRYVSQAKLREAVCV